jgi:hypothetical protein
VADHEWHGFHAAPLQAGYERLAWSPPSARTPCVRVRSHTCECEPVIYELCQAAGLMFVRRTVRAEHGDETRETEWRPAAYTLRVWGLILQGLAR